MKKFSNNGIARQWGYWLHNGKGSLVCFQTSSRSNGMVTFCRQDGTRGKLTSVEANAELNSLTEAGFRLVNSYGKSVECRCGFEVDTSDGVTLRVDGNIKLNEAHVGWDVSYIVASSCLDDAVSEFYTQFNADFMGKVTLVTSGGMKLDRAAFGLESKSHRDTLSVSF